jgi:hypothetical protein
MTMMSAGPIDSSMTTAQPTARKTGSRIEGKAKLEAAAANPTRIRTAPLNPDKLVDKIDIQYDNSCFGIAV